MTDDLRTRIAAAMYCHEHQASRSAWDGEDEYVHDYWRAAADAVIRELKLTRVTRTQNPPIHRYVTEWENDE